MLKSVHRTPVEDLTKIKQNIKEAHIKNKFVIHEKSSS